MSVPHTTFQPSTFQFSTFQIDLFALTDTTVIEKPIDCVLMGQQDMEVSRRVAEEFPQNLQASIAVEPAAPVRLSEKEPSFTVTTNSRGYD